MSNTNTSNYKSPDPLAGTIAMGDKIPKIVCENFSNYSNISSTLTEDQIRVTLTMLHPHSNRKSMGLLVLNLQLFQLVLHWPSLLTFQLLGELLGARIKN